MLKIIIYLLLICSLFAVNMIFPRILGGVPNLLFLLTVVYAFRKGNSDFLWLAFFSGLLLDIYGNTFFGTYAISFMIIALIINYTTRTFFSADPSAVYFAIVTGVSNLLLIGLIYIFSAIGVRIQSNFSALPQIYLHQKVWADMLLNLILAGPVYFLSLIVEDFLEKK